MQCVWSDCSKRKGGSPESVLTPKKDGKVATHTLNYFLLVTGETKSQSLMVMLYTT